MNEKPRPTQKLRGAGGDQRGLPELGALLEEMGDQPEELSREVIQEARELLSGASERLKQSELNDDKISEVIEALIKDTSFEGARIDIREYKHLGQRDVVENLQIVTFGDYTSGNAYNVWFERDNGQWVVACDRIPEGGNLRGM